jgi:CxxC motif-containing protein (DUF1111 family)
MPLSCFRSILAATLTLLFAQEAFAQRDPGVRGGMQNTAGGLQAQGIRIPQPPVISPNGDVGISDNEKRSFQEGILRAGQLESTCDECAMVTEGSPVFRNPRNGLRELDPTFPQFTTNSNGLGARHNADQCFGCHFQPTLGGSGGFLVPNPMDLARFGPAGARPPENPQFDLIPHRFGRRNMVPSFQQQYGPMREVRFIYKVDANGDFIRDSKGALIPDGGVHQLWTVRGMSNDNTIPNCTITQPNFEKQVQQNNVAFRIPLQMTGLGLIDSIQDREILARHAATQRQRAVLGIAGRPNRSGNDGTITRFGWKAQNKSLTMFAGEAYNVEMGISNELFPTATEEDPNCNGSGKPAPNDVTRMDSDDKENQSFSNPVHILADWMQFSLLMRFTDGPQPAPNPSQSVLRGKQLFSDIGCALCHTPAMQTAPAMNSAVLQNRQVNLYSDLMLHDMGAGLADGISQGQAGPREFRSTPLWGVGQRLFFLHDGRTGDLLEAIRAHRSDGSEANAVIKAFNDLQVADKQAILNFLRSL